MLLLHHLWPGDYTKETLLTFLFLPLTAWMAHLLMVRTTGTEFRSWWPVMALMNLAIFTPVLYQIVLWPMLFEVTCLTFFLGALLVSLTSKLPAVVKFVLGAACALGALLSFGTGVLLFVIPLPVIVLADVFRSKRERWIYFAAWLVLSAVSIFLYFHDLKNEVDPRFANKLEFGDDAMLQRNFTEIFHRPGAALVFVLRMMGTHFARGTGFAMMDLGLITGAVSFGLFVIAGGFWWKNRRDAKLNNALLPWLAYGSYAIGSALLVAMGRLKETVSGDNSLSARYVIHALPLTVALLALAWIIGKTLCERNVVLAPRVKNVLTGAACAYVVAQIFFWGYGARCMEVWSSSRLRNATNMMFFKTRVPIEGTIAPNNVLAKEANQLQLLNPLMLGDARLDNFELAGSFIIPNHALLDTMDFDQSYDGNEYLEVRGYACLDRRRRVADGVFLTRRDRSDGHWEIFRVIQVQAMPLYLEETIGRDMQHIFQPAGRRLHQEALSGFASYVPLEDVPEGENEVMAWAFDYRKQKVFPMLGFFKVDREKKTVTRLDEKMAGRPLNKMTDDELRKKMEGALKNFLSLEKQRPQKYEAGN